MRLTFDQRFHLVTWLKSLTQEQIDKDELSLTDLVKNYKRQEGGVGVTPAIMKKALVLADRKTAEVHRQRVEHFHKPAATEAVRPGGAAYGRLAVAVQELAAAVTMLTEHLTTGEKRLNELEASVSALVAARTDGICSVS